MALRPGDDALYIAERIGRIRVLRNGQAEPDPLLDISELTQAEGERGLLGLAFAPQGDRLYVNYTDPAGDTHLDEFTVAPDGSVDPSSQREVLFQDQPYPNHNGGQLVFGPDGYLYVGLGDGGSQRDPDRRALDLGTWLGKILRIDPRRAGDAPFSVPDDNPFVDDPEARPEIWSYGLRNPWRFTFDADTGDLWIGDVGQNRIEEVSVSRASDGAGRGVSFGWSASEGTNPINDDQPSTGHVPPVYEYPHELGCSITGGYVYRGEAIPGLQGAYVFADYCVPGIRAFALDASGQAPEPVDLTAEPDGIASFGEDATGELYVLSLQGVVARIDPA